MIRRIATVGGWTLVSRVTGFLRDVVMAAILGAGPLADAFVVAFRLPNHFRAIFAEGAFSAAFLPRYAATLETDGLAAARAFADRLAAATVVVQLVLLAIALYFTPQVIGLLAPGFTGERFDLAVTFTRITFPYLALISLETLIAGTLNANQRFASAAAAPVLLNISMIGTLLMAGLFPTAGHAAAWGVLIAGVLQTLFVAADAERNGFGVRLKLPRLDPPTKKFLKALGPAIIGAGGVQLALFADTIIATFLPPGAPSTLYYADRIHQLPIGVVGIAVGIVLLPEMSRRIAAGDKTGAAEAQGKAIQLALLIALPFAAGALAIPDLVMRALFARGEFSASEAHAAAEVLAAYAVGLVPFVLIRSFIAPFHARGDTATPVRAALTAAAVNILLKILLVDSLGVVGLALATSAGAWLNLALLIWFAQRNRFESPGVGRDQVARLAGAGIVAGMALLFGERLLAPLVAGLALRDELLLLVLLFFAAAVYAVLVTVLMGTTWLKGLARERSTAPVRPEAPVED
jgi:putative peptidoglycan lipid II flippase